MSVYLEQSATDSAMYEIYSYQDNKKILWTVVHEDMLGYLEGEYSFENGNNCIKLLGGDA